MATKTWATPTALGSLTTTFTQPPSCSVFYGTSVNGMRCSDGYAYRDLNCLPAMTVVLPRTGPFDPGWYSPGYVCSAGYTAACTSVLASIAQISTTENGFTFVHAPSALSETVIGYCPIGYRYQNRVYGAGVDRKLGQFCGSLASATSFPTASCSGNTSMAFHYVTLPAYMLSMQELKAVNGTPRIETAGLVTTANLQAPLFQLNFQPTDLANIARATDFANTETSPVLTASADSSVPAIPPTGFFVPTVVIPAVVPSVVSFVVLGAVMLLWWRSRRRLHLLQQSMQAELDASILRREMAVDGAPLEVSGEPVIPEASDGTFRQKLFTKEHAAELPEGCIKDRVERSKGGKTKDRPKMVGQRTR